MRVSAGDVGLEERHKAKEGVMKLGDKMEDGIVRQDRDQIKGDFYDWLDGFGSDNLSIPFPLIWRHGLKDGGEHRTEYLRLKTSEVHVETVQVKGVQCPLD